MNVTFVVRFFSFKKSYMEQENLKKKSLNDFCLGFNSYLIIYYAFYTKKSKNKWKKDKFERFLVFSHQIALFVLFSQESFTFYIIMW